MDINPKWVALSLSRHIGGKMMRALLTHFNNDLDAIFTADIEELTKIHGIGETIANSILALDVDKIAAEMSHWQKVGIEIITRFDPFYPSPLTEIDDEPPTLFVRGTWHPDLWQKTVAIVGTRTPSQEAKFLTMQLAAKLARDGYTIVSGLALGIDAAAHMGAIRAQGGGNTIAVLGSGVMNIYPPQNNHIAQQVKANGALISEVHPSISTNSQRLVARNRIISGLSRSVIVVESNEDGGAMHAAKRAIEQGRTVLTFDFPVEGNQQLIKDGAIIIPRDLTAEFTVGL